MASMIQRTKVYELWYFFGDGVTVEECVHPHMKAARHSFVLGNNSGAPMIAGSPNQWGFGRIYKLINILLLSIQDVLVVRHQQETNICDDTKLHYLVTIVNKNLILSIQDVLVVRHQQETNICDDTKLHYSVTIVNKNLIWDLFINWYIWSIL